MKHTQVVLTFSVLALLTSCNEDASMEEMRPKQEQSIVRNLPTQDRQYLLEPLEAALDDLREVVEYNPSFETVEETTHEEGKKVVSTYRLNGEDTVMVEHEMERPLLRERHQHYYDERGAIFLLEAKIVHLAADGAPIEKRVYRIYYEEGPVQLSAYGKVAYGENALPKDWVTICPTKEEETYLLSR
ncbi:MAG: hypothetical protein HQ500_00285 [Flavobacteriales bacterium]|nr:hypothetical protein [Flavobacteriales bacterium]